MQAFEFLGIVQYFGWGDEHLVAIGAKDSVHELTAGKTVIIRGVVAFWRDRIDHADPQFVIVLDDAGFAMNLRFDDGVIGPQPVAENPYALAFAIGEQTRCGVPGIVLAIQNDIGDPSTFFLHLNFKGGARRRHTHFRP